MKSIYIIALTILSSLTGAIAQNDVPAHWIHGLKDNSDIWKKYAPRFHDQRKMTSHTPEYSSTRVGTAKNTINTSINNGSENILIGHSMGGLVAREFERTNASRTRGIITVATPNQGAIIANNVSNGSARTMILRGVNDMIAGPHAEGKSLISNLGITSLPAYIASRIVNKEIDKFVEEDLFMEVDALITTQENNVAALTDLKVSSQLINDLNDRTATVPVANIICEENSQAALRLVNAYISPPEDAALNAYDDSGYVNAADKIRQIYKGFRIYHDVRKLTSLWRFKHHNRLANKWHAGERYLDNVFEADYNILIGATRYMPVTKTVYVYVCDSNNDCDDFDGLSRKAMCPPADPADCHYEWQTINTNEIRTEKSDGLLHVTTQKIPGISAANVYLAKEVNHMEVGNHPNIEAQYNLVFDRGDDLKIEIR